MVITFSNIKGSAGGGGATGGTVSGITLWSDETTKAYIDNALSGVTDVLSAYTKTEDFATINGSGITSGGNLVIEATPYTAGTNIDITDHIISVTGITVPTKVSELVNDSGYITTADTQNFVTSGDVQTQINDSISGKADSSAVTAQISEVKAQIEAEIPSKVSDLQNDLNFASTGDVESMISGFTTSGDVKTQIESYNYINSGQAQTQIDNSISGKLDTDIFTAYTANTKTELDNKQDISGMTEYATTAFTENTYAKIGDIPTKTSDLTNDSGFITDAALSGYATEQYVDNSVSGKVDNSALTQYYTSAQTDTAIQNATNGLASEEWVESQGYLKEHQSLSAYSTTEQMNQAIGSATAATTGWVESQGFLTEHQSLSAYTPTSGFATINGSAITEGGNIVVEETPYSGGANIDITDHIISVTGITVPTKLSELTNDEGFINSGQAQTQIDNAVNGKQDTLVSGENIKTINNQSLLGSGNIEIQGGGETYSAGEGIGIDADNIISVTGNYETIVEITQAEYDALTSYGKNTTYVITDAPAVNLSAYTPTSGFSTINGNVITDGGNIVIEGGSGSDYSAGTNIDITNHIISVTGITIPTSNTAFTNDAGYVNSGEVETQITSKGYLTGYTETDPVFQASAASGITEQNITNWNNKLDSSDLEPYYTSAQTDTAISNATSGKQDTLVSGTNIKTINNQSLLGSGNIEIQGGSGGSGGGETVIELTQSQYDALTGFAQDTTYIITDAPSVDLDNYYTSAQTESAITAQTSLKQDTLVSGTNIKTINGQSILGNGDIYISQGLYYHAGAGLNLINGNTFEVKDYKNLKQGARLGEIEKVISIALNDLNNRLKNLK